MKATNKAEKLEQYGPRNCPLIRSSHMTQAQWDAATLEFDDTMRRMGKRITWQTRFKRCPECGDDNLRKPKLRFGAVSGLCMPCSDKQVRQLRRDLGVR